MTKAFLPRFALTLAITGHRRIPADQADRVGRQLDEVLTSARAGAEAVSAWKKLLREERRRPEFSLLPWHSGVRLKYELALRCYPLYQLLRRGWLMVKGKRRG